MSIRDHISSRLEDYIRARIITLEEFRYRDERQEGELLSLRAILLKAGTFNHDK